MERDWNRLLGWHINSFGHIVYSLKLVAILLAEQTNTTQLLSHGALCSTKYGYIMDRNSRRNVSLCEDQVKHVKQRTTATSLVLSVYESTANQILISLNEVAGANFIVRLEGMFLCF